MEAFNVEYQGMVGRDTERGICPEMSGDLQQAKPAGVKCVRKPIPSLLKGSTRPRGEQEQRPGPGSYSDSSRGSRDVTPAM